MTLVSLRGGQPPLKEGSIPPGLQTLCYRVGLSGHYLQVVLRVLFNANTLLLVMDPLGNIPPIFVGPQTLEPESPPQGSVRETLIAYVVLLPSSSG